MKHLVIIDGHHLLYRAYWAIPRNMKNSKGEQVNMAFGYASMLMNILKAEQPDSLLLCFDADEKTFRHEQYEAYKAGRSPTPEDFYPQVPGVFRMLDAMGIKRVEGGGFEADDFACAYARAAEKQGDRVTIVSGDRDLFQLASDKIRVAIPHKGYQVPEYLGPKEVETKYGVTPAQIPSYKGLVGDSSDYLHGVLGIGPKAAAALLQKYGTLQNLYDHLPEVKESWRTKLEKDRESAFFCAKMAELICDLPFPVPLSELALSALPTADILSVFKDFEFTLLTKRLIALTELPYGKAHFLPAPAQTEAIAPTKNRKHQGSPDVASSQLSLL